MFRSSACSTSRVPSLRRNKAGATSYVSTYPVVKTTVLYQQYNIFHSYSFDADGGCGAHKQEGKHCVVREKLEYVVASADAL